MNTKQVIVIRKDLNMRKGKMCAQASHASMAFLTKKLKVSWYTKLLDTILFRDCNLTITEEEANWLDSSFRKIVVSVKDEEELESVARLAEEKGLTVHRIVDSGFTEFNGVPTFTCVALGPHEDWVFEGITDNLSLL